MIFTGRQYIRVLALAAVLGAPMAVQAQRGANPMQAAADAEAAGRLDEAFNGYMAALKALPPSATHKRELILRTRVVRVAVRMPSLPPVPAKAIAQAQQGVLAAKKGGNDGAQIAEQEFHRAVLAAPWYPEALFNLAVAQKNLGKISPALDNFRLYLLLKAPDADTVRALLIAVESARSEQEQAMQTKCALEQDKPTCASLITWHRDRCTQDRDCSGFGNLYLYRPVPGTEVDLSRGTEILTEGCDAGDAKSCYYLGKSTSDPRAADAWLRAVDPLDQECTVEDGASCDFLAGIYEDGGGVLQDLQRALQLMQRACDLETMRNGQRAKPEYYACTILELHR